MHCVSTLPSSELGLPTLSELQLEHQKHGRPVGRAYQLYDDLMFYLGRLWVPPSLCLRILSAFHDRPPFLHPGMRKTKATVAKLFAWPGMHDDVSKYLKGCLICQRHRASTPLAMSLKGVHCADTAFSKIHVDLWKASHNGVNYIVLTIIDSLTRWAEATSIPAATAEAVASALIRIWISRFGSPRVLVSDQGPEFTSVLLQNLCVKLGIEQIFSAPYHPEGNAPIETFHWTLRKGLTCLPPRQKASLTFDEKHSLVLMSYCATIHLTTGDTPAFLCHGTDLRVPMFQATLDRHPQNAERLRHVQAVRLNLLARAWWRWKTLQQQKCDRDDLLFCVGQLVLVELPPHQLRAATIQTRTGKKLLPKFSLPARIKEVLGSRTRAICVDLLTGKQNEVHISRARSLQPPATVEQYQQWFEQAEADGAALTDSEEKLEEFLGQFTNQLAMALPESTKSLRVKRRREMS